MAFPTQENIILESENAMGCKFPVSFRNKMLKENGGEIEINDEIWWLFPFYDKTNRKTISRTCNSISKETEYARTFSGFPQNVVVIAKNGCGDFLVFRKENDRLENEVYMWLHDDHTQLVKIADDFSQFC